MEHIIDVDHGAVRVSEAGRQIAIEAVKVALDRLAIERSEEHTSELQSLTNLVCRLLLEKKKKKKQINSISNNKRTIEQETHMTQQ